MPRGGACAPRAASRCSRRIGAHTRRLTPPLAAPPTQTTPLVAGVGVAAAAFVGKQLLQTYIKFRAAPPSFKAFYKGGFNSEMTRREAALILGLRESAPEERVKDAHRRIMIANHPDSGGSGYLAAKINEAKDVLLGKKKTPGSMF